MKNSTGLLLVIAFFFTACSTQRSISKQAQRTILHDSTLQHAHIGISIYDPATSKYFYNYQGDKYFVPASNTKIVTCYAALKYLGDSLTGLYYGENDTALYLIPAADPTLLHPDFKRQPVIDLLQRTKKPLYITDKNWQSTALGNGWSWGDYNEYYMTERSPLPVYGNVIRWVQENNSDKPVTDNIFDRSPSIYSDPEVNWKVRFNTDTSKKYFYVQRSRDENVFLISQGQEKKKEQLVPFVTNGLQSALELLPDTIGKQVLPIQFPRKFDLSLRAIHSQPTDSLLRPMMYNSDNFFAEQTLLMVSNQVLRMINDRKIIDTLLKSDLRDLPQPPRWADGSGLSRYNLFTPQSFVGILHKMQQEFGMDRLKHILPTGGKGTLGNFYKQDSGYIYAKTGTLSGVVALSGFLYTKANKLLIFSVLVNNHAGSAVAIRRQVEAFLTGIRKKY